MSRRCRSFHTFFLTPKGIRSCHIQLRLEIYGMRGLDTSTTYIFKHWAQKTWFKGFQASSFPKAHARDVLWEACKAKVWQRKGKKGCPSDWFYQFKYYRTSSQTYLWKLKVCLNIHRWFLKILLGVFSQAKIWSVWDLQSFKGFGWEIEWE